MAFISEIGWDSLPLDQETFHAIREIASRAIAVSTVEAGHQYTFVDRGDQSVQILITIPHGKNRGRADRFVPCPSCWRNTYRYNTFSIYPCSNTGRRFVATPLAIEITCAGSLYQMRLIYQGHLVARYLLVDLIQQERVLCWMEEP